MRQHQLQRILAFEVPSSCFSFTLYTLALKFAKFEKSISRMAVRIVNYMSLLSLGFFLFFHFSHVESKPGLQKKRETITFYFKQILSFVIRSNKWYASIQKGNFICTVWLYDVCKQYIVQVQKIIYAQYSGGSEGKQRWKDPY